MIWKQKNMGKYDMSNHKIVIQLEKCDENASFDFGICFINLFDLFQHLLWCNFAKFRFFTSQVWIFAFLRNFAKFRVKTCFSIFIITRCGFCMFCEIFREFQRFLSSYGEKIIFVSSHYGTWKMKKPYYVAWNNIVL